MLGKVSHTSACGDLLDGRVRVLTWNLWWRFGPWEARPAIAATLAPPDADELRY